MLFGFFDVDYFKFFDLFISVLGVGFKLGFVLFLVMLVLVFVVGFIGGDVKLFLSVSGVGKKIVECFVLELSSKVFEYFVVVVSGVVGGKCLVWVSSMVGYDVVDVLFVFGFCEV